MWWYDFFRSVNPEATTRSRRMTAIHKHATALSKLLAADEEYEGDAEFAERWRQLWPQDMPAANKIVNKMREVVEESGWLEASPQDFVAGTKGAHGMSDIGAQEWLLGGELPRVFQHFFRRRVSLYRKGDYVRFVLQVFQECGVSKPKPATIIRALTDARSGRTGRPRGGRK
jgi:hypothetical protein